MQDNAVNLMEQFLLSLEIHIPASASAESGHTGYCKL